MNSSPWLKAYRVEFHFTQHSIGHQVIFAESEYAARALANETVHEDIDDLAPMRGELSVQNVELLAEAEMEELEDE